jgi:polar amino acid transport system permease protein
VAYQFDFLSLTAYLPLLVKGVGVTIELIVVGGTLGLSLAIFCAWGRTQGPRWLKPLIGAYVELFRNTPFLIQLFFIFFGLPGIGVHLGAMEAAILATVVNLGAYCTEIIRAGLNGISRGQREAAQSLAMTRVQVFRHVLLRPALQKVWPAISSQLVIVMLGSSVCSQIAVEELSYAANFIQGRDFRAFETYAVATAIYLVLAIALRHVLRIIGDRYVVARRVPSPRAGSAVIRSGGQSA